MTPQARSIALMAEAAAFPKGSPDRNYRERAAWTYDQMGRKVPSCNWTDVPPAAFLARHGQQVAA